MKIDLLDAHKKKDFLKEISYLGEFKMHELFLRAGKEQVRIFSGSLHYDDIMKIWRHFPVEAFGLYFGKQFIDRHGRKDTRMSLDGLHVIKDSITKNIVALNAEQVQKWFRGENIELNPEQKGKYLPIKGQFVAVQFEETGDFIGTAKLSEHLILNSFLPKERRVRN